MSDKNKPTDLVNLVSKSGNTYQYSPSTGRIFAPQSLKENLDDLIRQGAAASDANNLMVQAIFDALAATQVKNQKSLQAIWLSIEADLSSFESDGVKYYGAGKTEYKFNSANCEIIVGEADEGGNNQAPINKMQIN